MRSDPRGDKDGSPRRLWVQFEDRSRPAGYEGPIGYTNGLPTRFVGVTGLDAAHCWRLVSEPFPSGRQPSVRTAVWDIDVSTVDRVPTGNPAALGVWYVGP